MPPIYIAYLNRLDIDELKITDEEILSAIEASLASQGRGETVIEPRVHLEPGGRQRPFQRAARRHQARRSIPPASRSSATSSTTTSSACPPNSAILALFDPAHRRAEGDPRCQRHHRHAHRRGDRDRRQTSGAQELEDPRPYRRARHRLLERAAARSSLRFRRDPRPFPAPGEPQRLCRAAEPRSRQEGRRHRGLAELRRGRRHRGRGLAARQADADAEDRLDQEGRLRRSLWHDERDRAVADRHHGEAGGRRLGPVQGRQVRQPARPCRGRQAVRNRRFTPNSGRSSPA